MNKFWKWMVGLVVSVAAVSIGLFAYLDGFGLFKPREPEPPAPGEEVAPVDGVEPTDELAQHLLDECGTSASFEDARKRLEENPEVLAAVSASFENRPFDPFSVHWPDAEDIARDTLQSPTDGIGEVCDRVRQIDQIQADMVTILERVGPTLSDAESQVQEDIKSDIEDFVLIGDAQIGLARQAINLDISRFGDERNGLDLYPLFSADDKSFFVEDLLQFYDAIAFGFLGKTRHTGFQSIDDINRFLEENAEPINEVLTIFGSTRDSYTFAYEPFVPLLRPFLQPDAHQDSPLHSVGIGR